MFFTLISLFGIKPKTLYTRNKCSSLSLSYIALDDRRQTNKFTGLDSDGDLDHLGGPVLSDLSPLKFLYPPPQCCLWKGTVTCM